MKKPRTIISLAAGESQVPLIKAAKEMGFKVVAIDRNPSAPGFNYSDISIIESTHNIDASISALKKYAWNHTYSGILARTTGKPLHTAAAISREFNLLGLTDDFVKIATEKSSLRTFCTTGRINCPRGLQVKHMPIAHNLDFPLILKPDKSKVGKTEIYVCNSSRDVSQHFSKASSLSSDGKVEIESFIDGIDCTCLCLAHEGKLLSLAWLDELVGVSDSGKIIGLGVSIPSVITDTPAAIKAENMVKRIVRSFPSIYTLLLVSFRVTMKGTPYIIEIHADLGGDLIAERLLPVANEKFDFFKLAVTVATGKELPIKKLRFKPTLLCYRNNAIGPKNYEEQRTIIFQKGTIGKNLICFAEFILQGNTRFRLIPKHLEWLTNISDKK